MHLFGFLPRKIWRADVTLTERRIPGDRSGSQKYLAKGEALHEATQPESKVENPQKLAKAHQKRKSPLWTCAMAGGHRVQISALLAASEWQWRRGRERGRWRR